MRNCLLCSQEVEENRTFSSLILLQKEQNTICKHCRAGFEAISSIHCPRCWKEEETEFARIVKPGKRKATWCSIRLAFFIMI